MKKLLVTFMLSILTLLCVGLPKKVSACHESYTTLVSAPTSIGGGQYSTTVQFCIGQTVNWGGSFDFTVTLNGANIVSYSPSTLSNTYGAYTTATCSGPNCFMGTCTSITANSGSVQAGNTITYTTTSSTPAGYPLVPDDVEQCGGNPMSYCFNFTFVSDGYPTSITMAGNLEMYRPRVCNTVCGHSSTYAGGPCNGTYEPALTYTFGTPLPIELVDFSVLNKNEVNKLSWITASEINNDFYIIENSVDGFNWDIIDKVNGMGNSSNITDYSYEHENYKDTINYYRLTQVDFDGRRETFKIVVVDNTIEPKVIVGMYNYMGRQINSDYRGLYIILYSDGTTEKVIKQ